MRNYTAIMHDCMQELGSIGLSTYSKRIVSITINNRLSRSLGRCRRIGRDFFIELAGKVARDDVDLHFIKNIIMHELVHTMPECFNHGYMFQRTAAIINKRLGYNVGTHETAENMIAAGVKPINKKEEAKYAICCGKCGKTVAYRQKKCGLTDNPGNYTHTGCGGKLYTLRLGWDATITTK